MVSQAGSEIIDQVGKVRGAIRRHNFRKKAEESHLTAIQDPITAAGILLFSLAIEDDKAIPYAMQEITDKLGKIISKQEAEEVAIFSEWAAKSVTTPRDVVRRYIPLWSEKLSTEERLQLFSMADDIAKLGGPETIT